MSRLHEDFEKGTGATEGDQLGLVKAGRALSNPGETEILKKLTIAAGKGDGGLRQFPSSEHLLKTMEPESGSKSSDSAKGPQFPLTESYNPETGYSDASGKPTARGQQLQAEAKKLVDSLAAADGSLSLKDHGKMMDSISKENISEADKWYLYKQICREESKGRNAEGRLIPGTKEHRVLFDEAPPDGLHRSGKGDVVRHIIIDPTSDAYHGGLVYGSRNLGAGFLRGEAGIFMHEDVAKPVENWYRGEGFGVNHGDEEASHRQLRALKAMQGEGSAKPGFDSYAKVWNEGFGH